MIKITLIISGLCAVLGHGGGCFAACSSIGSDYRASINMKDYDECRVKPAKPTKNNFKKFAIIREKSLISSRYESLGIYLAHDKVEEDRLASAQECAERQGANGIIITDKQRSVILNSQHSIEKTNEMMCIQYEYEIVRFH
jgi:hypothetical protein